MLIAPIKYSLHKLLQILLPLLMLSSGLYGQSFILSKYNSKDGLAHDNVRDITVDSSGFMWLATWDGLSRYDGTDFINYYHNPGDSTSISYFSVDRVVIDAEDNLWLVTDDAKLSIMNRADETFHVINNIGNHRISGLINLSSDPDGFLYFALADEVLKYNPRDGRHISYRYSGKLKDGASPQYSTYDIIFDGPDHIWLGGINMIELQLVTDGDGDSGTAIIQSVNRVERGRGRVGSFFDETGAGRITHDRSGNTWLAARTGLFLYDSEQKLFREYSGNTSEIRFADSLPLMFYDQHSGLNIRLPQNDTLIRIPQSECGLPVNIFYYDQNLFWVSYHSLGGTPSGICKVVISPYEFRLINPFPVRNSELTVFGITEDIKGNLWVAARDRDYLIRITPGGTAEQINILSDSELKEVWHPRAFLSDSNGIWIGYFYNELLYYNLSTGNVTRHYPGRMIHTMAFDEDGKILIGDRGIVRYDPEKRKIDRLLAADDSMSIFTFCRIENILWVGCGHQFLIRYDLKDNSYRYIKVAKGLSNIEAICPGEGGELWLAFLGGGVCLYNPVTGSTTFYTTSSGLSNNTIYGILKDRDNNMWVSTNNGISVINPSSGQIRSFGPNDGLSIHEFNSDAAYVTRDGMFNFGGVGGIARFSPEQVLSAHSVEKMNRILITGIEVSAAKRILRVPVYKADTIVLNKGEDNFHISFVVPDYRYPENIRYRYRLGGEPENWYLKTHKDRNINYSNLKPGTYNLEIQATGLNGSWTNPKKLVIIVKPYFYQTKFFIIAAPSAVLLLIFLVAYILFMQYRTREKHKRETLRHQALRAQMNPHFIFNALNSINYFISRNDSLSANRFISDFSKLIRTTLANMNEEFVRLGTELESVEEYLKIEHLRFGDRFDYVISVDPVIVPDTVNVSPGLVQPFVENAIWHGIMGLEGRKGIIRLLFSMRDTTLTCTVEDDGIGRKRSEALKDTSNNKKSRGIALAFERMKLINSIQSTAFRIRITDLYPERKDTGTRVEIEMPVQKS
jgi:ligand-binding sensor domain-containing protein